MKSYFYFVYRIQVILRSTEIWKTLTLVTISQEYHMPNSHTSNEAVTQDSSFQEE